MLLSFNFKGKKAKNTSRFHIMVVISLHCFSANLNLNDANHDVAII